MNLNNLNLVELNAQEVQEVDGGWYALALTAAGLVGAAMSWGFQKGEELGKALA